MKCCQTFGFSNPKETMQLISTAFSNTLGNVKHVLPRTRRFHCCVQIAQHLFSCSCPGPSSNDNTNIYVCVLNAQSARRLASLESHEAKLLPVGQEDDRDASETIWFLSTGCCDWNAASQRRLLRSKSRSSNFNAFCKFWQTRQICPIQYSFTYTCT